MKNEIYRFCKIFQVDKILFEEIPSKIIKSSIELFFSQMRPDFLERFFYRYVGTKPDSTEKEALETELSVNLMACRGSLRLSMLLINTLQQPSANAISKRRSTNTFSYF